MSKQSRKRKRRTGGGPGSNQYKLRGKATQQTKIPELSPLDREITLAPTYSPNATVELKRRQAKTTDDPVTLAVLAIDMDGGVRQAVARNLGTPRGCLIDLMADVDYKVAKTAMMNQRVHPYVIDMLQNDLRYRATVQRIGVVNQAQVPPSQRAERLPRESQDQQQRPCGEIWGHGCTVLVNGPQWTHDSRPHGLNKVKTANNPDSHPLALATIADDPDVWVRSRLLYNPSTPEEILDTIAQDEDIRGDWAWCMTLARHPNASVPLLAELAQDRNVEIRRNAINHPNVPDHIKALLVLAF